METNPSTFPQHFLFFYHQYSARLSNRAWGYLMFQKSTTRKQCLLLFSSKHSQKAPKQGMSSKNNNYTRVSCLRIVNSPHNDMGRWRVEMRLWIDEHHGAIFD
jgi:hypothetical protein